MDIYLTTMRTLAATTANDELFAVAVNNVIPLGAGAASDKMLCYLSIVPGKLKTGLGSIVGGTSVPVTKVQPSYFPFATEGAECAAIVSNTDWADDNLQAGYEYLQLNNDNATPRYFVSGVLNSSETQFNDPFADTNVIKAVCWEGAFKIGVNPF